MPICKPQTVSYATWLREFMQVYALYATCGISYDDARFYYDRGYAPQDAAMIAADVDPTNY